MVMCTGHLAEQIENQFGDGRAWNVVVEYSREPHALGTGGAIKLAERYLRGVGDFLVLNGDSFLEVDFRELVGFHREHNGLVSIAVWRARNAARYGTVRIGASGRVIDFAEKTDNDSPGLINAGVYVFSSGVLEHIPDGPVSLERDVFPHLLDHGVYALEQHGAFIDIGTPEDYTRAQQLADCLNNLAVRESSLTSGQEKVLVRSEVGKRVNETKE
jgi:NDP-sugar pyrophosphorylase family protein